MKAPVGVLLAGHAIAAEYIKFGGLDAWKAFRSKIHEEINEVLASEGLPKAEAIYELPGSLVNLSYPLPNRQSAKFLDDRKIYLGCQFEVPGLGVCYGAVAGMDSILLCSYSQNGSEPQLVQYRRR